ncbi:MAG TPA: cytochrome c peroxidase [Chitinophagaceae bacterium]|nr:cytochrome c peroxidase [Chitinophagaceae bacterium]
MPAFHHKKLLILFSLACIVVIACKKSNDSADPVDPVAAVLNLPSTPFNYSNIALPAYLNTPPIQGQVNTPATNPITDNGATLGRVLFYDKSLSINNTIACASCHKQANGFADTEVKSKGFNGGLTGRNSMSLIDAKFYPNGRFFWDQRAATLEVQTLTPIQDLVEMGMTLPQLETKLRTLAYYPPLFQKAFGDTAINSGRISSALAQFVRSIVSYQSKYDAGRAAFPAGNPPPPDVPFANFTPQENRGKEIFLSPIGGCAPCHGSETFTAPQEKNNGIDMATTDRGFGAVTNNINLDATFKVTTLRNVELTAPYMHDGRFQTLEEVVEHYSSGVKNHPNLSPQLRLPNGQPRQANLNVQDKAALVAFLKTLTDPTIATEVKYSNPFK